MKIMMLRRFRIFLKDLARLDLVEKFYKERHISVEERMEVLVLEFFL